MSAPIYRMGIYGLPRFELPEWLWERLPRSDPGHVLAELGRLGPLLHLDEPTLSNEWIRFDAPGDFQLCLREDFYADRRLRRSDAARLARRLQLQPAHVRPSGLHRQPRPTCRGLPLQPQSHPDRLPRLGARERSTRFYRLSSTPSSPAQRDMWGLPTPSSKRSAPQSSAAFSSRRSWPRLPDPGAAQGASAMRRGGHRAHYDSRHVLPFVADSIAVSAAGNDGRLPRGEPGARGDARAPARPARR